MKISLLYLIVFLKSQYVYLLVKSLGLTEGIPVTWHLRVIRNTDLTVRIYSGLELHCQVLFLPWTGRLNQVACSENQTEEIKGLTHFAFCSLVLLCTLFHVGSNYFAPEAESSSKWTREATSQVWSSPAGKSWQSTTFFLSLSFPCRKNNHWTPVLSENWPYPWTPKTHGIAKIQPEGRWGFDKL